MRSVLRRPDFRLLFVALVASMAAESVLLLALAVWVKDLTGSDGMAGATIFAIIAPMTLAPLVGWLVDRHRRRPFFVAANLGTAVLLSPLLAVHDRADVWVIYVVAALYGLSYITLSAVLSGLIRHLVPSDLLADANGVLQTVRQGLRLVGPLAGAGLYAAVGGWLLVALAMTGFLTAAGVVGLLRVTETVPSGADLRWPAELGAGLRHLAGEPALRRALLGYGLGSLVMGFTESLIFAYVDQGLRRDVAFVGVLVTVQGIGGLVGGLLSATVVRRAGEVGALAAGVTFFGPAALALAYPRLWLGVVALLLAGVSLPLTMVGLNTLVQRRTPAALLGRVAAASEALVSGPQALSIGTGAVLVGVVDYRLLFALVGVTTTAAGLYLWHGRRLTPPRAAPARIPAPRRPADPVDHGVVAATHRPRAR
ncbi:MULTISPECIES: MFS transporter [Micromonospora]|uniref:MFS transporter n=1 Tax=Micromonospora solifontis TaxID=2487138 RepID=A0ABX9WL95_9ACTN|nr:MULTISPECIES: MFS transporter [Micromonospora]NES15368.1 MFS transporter [Micromonospora sp. PPF5-17B]NES36159.1 MFS transporter [Micromonospora solifontis]NES56716.1 MFS transporter [Micromonospora sp. PPF5-6]RNL99912.1 MFS transporter [Micromonospora solifontis]